jgi:hypothetical protein
MNRIHLRSSIVCGVSGLLMSVMLMAGCGSSDSNALQSSHSGHQTDSQASNQAGAKPTPRIPAFFENLDKAKPLPAVLDPRQFSDPVVAKAYSYAQEHPEIFAQQPCYCYCDAGDGHKSLLDCYATTHSVG